MWRPMTDKPDVGKKFIALYNDGSGAVMFFAHNDGFIDSDGDEVQALTNFDRWAYLPDDLEFWCESIGDEAITLACL